VSKVYFVVEMLRNNDREQHSYIDGIYDDETLALKSAWEHMTDRAGKYGAEVSGYKINGGARVYFHKLDCWDAFAESCKDMAEKLRAMIPELSDSSKPKDSGGEG
jgi:hypothetical protein